MPRLVSAELLLSLALLSSSRLWGQSPAARNWFDAPQTMCRALDALGFIAGVWAPAAKETPVYLCAYPPLSRPEDVPALADLARANQRQPLPPDVSFEVTGLHRTTADTITLTVSIIKPAEKAKTKKRLLACIQTLYHAIGRPVPSALPAYLEKEEHYLAHEPYGIVSLFTTLRDGSPQRLWFRLGRNP